MHCTVLYSIVFVQKSKRGLLADLVAAGGLSGRDLARVCEQAVADVPASEADRARFLEDITALSSPGAPSAPPVRGAGGPGYDGRNDYAQPPSRYYD